ncbi:MAG: glycosyltransferase involved in cell wall biosynthesis [Alteromonas naphthalenivorans]|jgi:glycosyltransferase involved in cell wall biosynthesis
MQDLKHSYSNGVFNKKIVVLGPTPLPYGGVSVHIQRVIDIFKKQKNKIFVFDSTQIYTSYTRYLVRLFFFVTSHWPDIVYYHTPDGNDYYELHTLRYLQSLFKFKLIIIDHDCRYLFDRDSNFKAIYNNLLKQVAQIVFIGEITYKSYISNNMYIPKSFSIESSYSPPNIDNKDNEWLKYPKLLHQFVKSHSPVLAMSVYKFTLLNGEDLYGVDLAIKAMIGLREKYSKVGLVCAVGDDKASDYYQVIQHIIKENNLEENVYFLHGDHALWPLFFHIDLFIRPTRSDSYGISIAEAIDCGIPALASDVCVRHKNAHIFKNEKDFFPKISMILNCIKA